MINSQNNLPPEIQATADEQLLAVRTPRLVYKLAAMQKKLPSKGGTTLRSSRYDRLPTAIVPLGADGAPIPSTPLNRVDIDATVSQTILAHVKFFLIDLKALVTGNKGQA